MVPAAGLGLFTALIATWAPAPGRVVDDHRVAVLVVHLVRDHARHLVGRTSGWVRNDQCHPFILGMRLRPNGNDGPQ
jgi:hypothetical protein